MDKSSLLSGFGQFLRMKLQSNVPDVNVCSNDVELKEMKTINLNRDVQTNVQPIGESSHQQEELDSIFSQHQSLSQQTSNDDEETVDNNLQVSTPQNNVQIQQHNFRNSEAPNMDATEQTGVMQSFIQQSQQQMQSEWDEIQLQLQQHQIQSIITTQDELHRQQVATEAQQLLQEYLTSISHTTSSGIDDDFCVQSSNNSNVQLGTNSQIFQQSQPVAEAGPSSTQQPQQQQQQQPQYSNIKYEKPVTFNGKHADTENFIFSMQAYVHAVKMSDRDAAEFLTLYLRGDAMTWWRSYCTTNGGLTNVFSTKSFKDLLKELRSEFSDVDREMQLRNKLFNIHQTASVQQYVTLFRNTMVDLGTSQITMETAKHLFLHGLKSHIRREVFMHRPSTFQDMLQLAERADQAFMADRSGALQSRTSQGSNNYRSLFGNGSRGQYGNGSGRGNFGGRQQVNYQNVSQYGNQQYKGPAPMVLGNVGETPVCYYCNKPGHLRKDCYKMRNDLAGGRFSGRGQSRGGGRTAGRQMGRNVLNAVGGTTDMNEVLRLGMAAVANRDKQATGQQAVGEKNVRFADDQGQYPTQSKN